MRVAAIDLGTNSTRLLVADVDRGRITEVVRRLAITRLGEGVDVNHELLPAPIARVHTVLEGYAHEAAALEVERALAVATSAVRDASSGRDFLDSLGERYRWETKLLDGEQEAEDDVPRPSPPTVRSTSRRCGRLARLALGSQP